MGLAACSGPRGGGDGTAAARAGGETDLANGAAVFRAGGCATCHALPGADARGVPRLGGGRRLDTRFGTFRVPNISPDTATGIGTWTLAEFDAAMRRGRRPDGAHYYPAFPYTSYARMTGADIRDLWAYLRGLPPVPNVVAGHALRAPFRSRRALGVWKRLYLRPAPVVSLADAGPQVARGRYLVEAIGHCGACHTPRDALGGPDYRRWLAGSTKLASGPVPNITSGAPGIAGRSVEEIAQGLLPAATHAVAGDYGFAMEAVRRNLAHLSGSDRRAIAAYLKVVPTRPGEG
jgi:mono/diheme cytochrome c family protein